MTEGISVVLASVPDRKSVVAEIWLSEDLVAEIRLESGELAMNIYPRANGQPWQLNPVAFSEAIQSASKSLNERRAV